MIRGVTIPLLLLGILLTFIPLCKGQATSSRPGGMTTRAGSPGRLDPTKPPPNKPLPTKPTSLAPGEEIGKKEGEADEPFSDGAKRGSFELFKQLCIYKVEPFSMQGVAMGYKAQFTCPNFAEFKGMGRSKTEDGAVSNAARDLILQAVSQLTVNE